MPCAGAEQAEDPDWCFCCFSMDHTWVAPSGSQTSLQIRCYLGIFKIWFIHSYGLHMVEVFSQRFTCCEAWSPIWRCWGGGTLRGGAWWNVIKSWSFLSQKWISAGFAESVGPHRGEWVLKRLGCYKKQAWPLPSLFFPISYDLSFLHVFQPWYYPPCCDVARRHLLELKKCQPHAFGAPKLWTK